MPFPLRFVPTVNYRGGRGYGASRAKIRKGLLHGACDLIARPGTPILSVDDGRVVLGPYRFFRGTYAIEVRYRLFIVRYCEIALKGAAKAGKQVKAGEVIAYVGNQPGYDMLHFEMFSGKAHGPLTNKTMPYCRRKDLINPTSHLDRWAIQLKGAKQTTHSRSVSPR